MTKPTPRLAGGAVAPRESSPTSLYQHVGERLAELIPLFGLRPVSATIARTYALLCRQSLDIPWGHRPAHASRLNADGTPFQFSLTLGAPALALQFLADTGPPTADAAQRLVAQRQCIRDLASLFGAQASLSRVSPWLDDLAPDDDPELLAADAGAIWIGAGFTPRRGARLKVYVNAKWGSASSRWARLAAFAGRLGVAEEWCRAQRWVSALEPLGVALIIGCDTPVSGRIYLSGYGRPLDDYEMLAGRFGGNASQRHLRQFGAALFADDCAYPTRSAVASFGLQPAGIADAKFEFCGHCAFDSDVQAATRCTRWLQQIGVDPAMYTQLVGLLSGGAPSDTEVGLHSYVGIGSRRDQLYSTFYFNPAASGR